MIHAKKSDLYSKEIHWTVQFEGCRTTMVDWEWHARVEDDYILGEPVTNVDVKPVQTGRTAVQLNNPIPWQFEGHNQHKQIASQTTTGPYIQMQLIV